MPDRHSDIVVIGAGIAGLVAAHECLEQGRSVTIIDRHDAANVGGLARTAFGGMALVGTPVQRRMGVKDTPALALSGRNAGPRPTSNRVPTAYFTGCAIRACASCRP